MVSGHLQIPPGPNLLGPLRPASPGPLAIIRKDPGEINPDERRKYQQLKIDS